MNSLAQVQTIAAVATLQASFAAQQAGLAEAAAQSISTIPVSWTPTDASGGGNTLSSASGQWNQIANLIIAEFVATYPGTVVNGSNTATVTIPVAVPNHTFARDTAACIVSGMGTATAVLLVTNPNTSTASFYNPSTQSYITNTLMAGATVACVLKYSAL